MYLNDIKGSYDVIVSLGSACNTAMLLRQYNLRRFSGPLDWKVSGSLSDVNRLLREKFVNFMELENMTLLDGTGNGVDDGIDLQPVSSHIVRDNYISFHDFPIHPNLDWSATYPSFKEKLNYRIDRFLERITNSQSILFVRWAGGYDQAVELQSVLNGIVKGKYNILILEPVEGFQGVKEMNWGIERVCALIVPNLPYDHSTWEYVLNGIILNN